MKAEAYVDIVGVEFTLYIEYEYSPPEYNWGEGIDIEDVYFIDKNGCQVSLDWEPLGLEEVLQDFCMHDYYEQSAIAEDRKADYKEDDYGC